MPVRDIDIIAKSYIEIQDKHQEPVKIVNSASDFATIFTSTQANTIFGINANLDFTGINLNRSSSKPHKNIAVIKSYPKC